MKSDNFIKLSFAFMVTGLAFLGWLAYIDYPLQEKFWFGLVQLFTLPFMVTAVVELNGSEKLDKKEKTMWTFGFIALTLITGILYFASERKRVLSA